MALQDQIRQNNFVIIGRAGVDFYADPPGTKTEQATQFFSCLGGSSANIGVAIVKLGGKASLVTCVSDDALGRLALNELAKYGIDARHVRSVGGEVRTSLAVVETRIEDHQSVIYRNNAADFQMNEADIDRIDFAGFGALITTGTVLAAQPSRDATMKAFKLAKAAGLPIIFDIDYRPYSWSSGAEAASVYSAAADYCDIIIGNDDEFGVMAGRKQDGLPLAQKLAQASAQIVIYKKGEFGSTTFHDGGSFQTGIFPVEALKPTGAGDSFLGAFIASLAAGLSVEDSVARGSAAAAIVVSRVGCAPAMPTLADLENFINTHDGLSPVDA
uniref:5-dehydro-2-deoxygluconokinase n=1 Tax=Pararhizobium sp. IMCC3301 TaxID=3067904 RepID=UPI002740385C|nr:5-dehydro-2-deoxygluconokinase [Pararhizobium sp. IMCC3301]